MRVIRPKALRHGDVIGITRFGASAPDKVLFTQYGFTVENVLARAKKLLAADKGSLHSKG